MTIRVQINRLLKTALAATMLSLSLGSVSIAADYVIDSSSNGAHSSIQFKIGHMGFSWLIGSFDKFEGTFSYDDKKPEASAVEVTIDTASVDSNHAKRDKHLRSDDFLEVEKYPNAKFESTSYKASEKNKGILTGNLTLHGVTKEVSIDVELVGAGNDPWGGYRIGFIGTTQLKLQDYKIKKNLGPASEMVYLTFNIEGIKK